MKNWFNDGILRSVVKKAGQLASTKLLGGIIGLLGLVCTGRGLSADLFGTVMLIHAYALGASALTKSQSWQMIIRYGAPALTRGDTLPARLAIRFACAIDAVAGVIGMIGAMLALFFFGTKFGVKQEHIPLAIAYCTLIPTMSCATPAGALRLLDRFDLLSIQQIATPLIRSLGAVLAWISGLGMPAYLLSWYIADIVGDLVLWGMAVVVLDRHRMLDALRPSLFAAPRKLPKVWSFVWTTNLNTTLAVGKEPISNVIVGGMLGPAAVGIYKIATSVINSATKPATLMEKGFYPEIMRLDPHTTRPWKLALKTGFLAGCIGLAVALAIMLLGHPVVSLFGKKYRESASLLIMMAPALVITLSAFPMESLLYMAGRPKALFYSHIVGTGAYIAALVYMTQNFGLYGAGAAFIVGPLLLSLCALVPTVYCFFIRRSIVPPTPIQLAADDAGMEEEALAEN